MTADLPFTADPTIAGVDEAGRGPLAGPVVAAAVILSPDHPIEGLRDSKKLSARRREALADEIREKALAFAVASASVEEIDRLNILHATLLAMTRAIQGLEPQPRHVRIDGNRAPRLEGLRVETVIGGDDQDPAIAAASILAKTVRDHLMLQYAEQFPAYGFERHMGYGMAVHMAALREYGPCEIHRRSFAPVARVLAVDRQGEATFMRVQCAPVAALHGVTHVMVLQPVRFEQPAPDASGAPAGRTS